MYLQNADQSKYGSILKILNDKKSLNNDQYNKTMFEATKVLINHWYNNANQMNRHKKGQDQNNDKDEENNENVPGLAFMMDGRCYCFGKVGHKYPQCRYKDRPRNEWVINK